MNQRIFEGLNVLDFTNNVAGPGAGAMLADYGAEVIKIERPIFGDDTRSWGSSVTESFSWYTWLNRGKKSVTISLTDPEGLAIIEKMVADADVILQAFRPGVMQRFSLDYDSVSKVNPSLVYCSISAFGQTGPKAKKPGYDQMAQAYTGLTDMTGEPDGPPTRVSISIIDHSTAINAFGSICAALYHREKTGEGQHIDVSLVGTAFSMNDLFEEVAEGAASGISIKPTRTGRLSSYPGAGTYKGKGNQYCEIAANNQKLWGLLCQAMERPDLITDPRSDSDLSRMDNASLLHNTIEDWVASFDDINVALEKLDKLGVPSIKVNSVGDLVTDEHLLARGAITDIPAPTSMQARGVKTIRARGPWHVLSKTPLQMRKAPDLGEHNVEVLAQYGLSVEEIGTLQEKWNKSR
ncbi:CaiB/BaiF CoA-transferase family protein [Mesorhizobium sp. M0715]|uniref:CaiB/BaiF CoA transferase family protein n=1 Tax=Mesorhizobium sp. M0715 TaxID=2956990 RepID=UPI00333D7771